jgi:hypothetical protein
MILIGIFFQKILWYLGKKKNSTSTRLDEKIGQGQQL